MSKPLRVLIVEDSKDDTVLLLRELQRGGYAPAYLQVDNATMMSQALTGQQWDIILADYRLPRFSASHALQLVQESNHDLPFIVVSGAIGEEMAVAMMKAGAHDYVMKDNLARLLPVIGRELQEASGRREQRRAETALRQSEKRQAAILDALPAHIALLDKQGNILTVNEAWRRFALENALQDEDYGIGRNYLDICDSAQGESAEGAAEAATAIRMVLSGQKEILTIEYSGHASQKRRWYQMDVTCLSSTMVEGAVVSHLDATDQKMAEMAIRHYAAQADALAGLSQALVQAELDSQAVFEIVVRYTAELIGDACVLALLSEDGQWLRPVAFHHLDPAARALMVRILETAPAHVGNDLTHWLLLQEGRPVLISHVPQDQLSQMFQAEYWPYIEQVGIHSLLVVPLRVEGRVIGTLGVTRDRSDHPYNDDDQIFLLNMADRTALKLSNARLVEAERQQYLQAETLREVTLALTSQTDLEVVLDEILSQAGRLVAYRTAHIMLLEGDRLTMARWRGYEVDSVKMLISGLKHAPDELPLDSQAIRSGLPVVVSDTRREPQWVVFEATAWVRSCLIVPIRLGEQVLGILRLDSSQPGEFSMGDAEKLRPMVSAAAIALENARLFEAVNVGHERLRSLSQQLVEAQEAERRRIARELHDEIGQSLTAIKLNLQTLRRYQDPERIEQGIEAVEQALQQVRNLSLDLRPALLDDLGVTAALRWYVDRQAQMAGFRTKLRLDSIETSLPTGLETTCYRLVQEALTNIIKHAQASEVRVELQNRNETIRLIIEDDGCGFDVAAALKQATQGKSLGLLSMEERVTLLGGQFNIDSAPDRGTRIQAIFSLKEPAPQRGSSSIN